MSYSWQRAKKHGKAMKYLFLQWFARDSGWHKERKQVGFRDKRSIKKARIRRIRRERIDAP